MKVLEVIVGSDEAACLFRDLFHKVGCDPQITVDREGASGCVEFPVVRTEFGFYEGLAAQKVLDQLRKHPRRKNRDH
jgi:hypothetical protein